jgi:hypothetical protein
MDPGSLGAVIGISVMVALVIGFQIRETCRKRKKKPLTVKTPLLSVPVEPKPVLLTARHVKMNTILPPVKSARRVLLESQNMTASRSLKI